MESSTTTLIIIVAVALLVVGVIVLFVVRRQNSHRLRSRFGAEYDRIVEEQGDTRKAESELRERQKRVSRLEIAPLTPSARDGFITRWREIQAEFVDEPKTALNNADSLLSDVMRARGYPVEDFDQRSADLSVDHPVVVQNYRAGHDIALRHKRGEADTEDLRRAMLNYRTLFDELVGEVADTDKRQAS